MPQTIHDPLKLADDILAGTLLDEETALSATTVFGQGREGSGDDA